MSRAASKTTSRSGRAASKTTSRSGRAASKTTSRSSRAASKTTSPSTRLLGLVLPALLAVALLLPATAASAAPTADGVVAPDAAAVTVLAAEGGPEGPQGPEPGDPDDTENPAAPENYEAPFLWAASVGLLALAILGTLALAGLYYLLVHRPSRDEKTAGRK